MWTDVAQMQFHIDFQGTEQQKQQHIISNKTHFRLNESNDTECAILLGANPLCKHASNFKDNVEIIIFCNF